MHSLANKTKLSLLMVISTAVLLLGTPGPLPGVSSAVQVCESVEEVTYSPARTDIDLHWKIETCGLMDEVTRTFSSTSHSVTLFCETVPKHHIGGPDDCSDFAPRSWELIFFGEKDGLRKYDFRDTTLNVMEALGKSRTFNELVDVAQTCVSLEFDDPIGKTFGIVRTKVQLISGIGGAPVLCPTGTKNVNEETTLRFTALARDPEGNPPTFSLGPGAPAGASITSGGVFTWTPSESQGPGTYSVTIVVSDGSLSDSETVTITVNETNKAPVLNVPGPQTVKVGNTLNFTVTASDPDIPANSITLSPSNLVVGMTFDSATGIFTFTPTRKQAGKTFTVDFTATDNGTPSLSTTKSVAITVTRK